MAFSQSARPAQLSKACELCETDIKIQWKCLQCNTYMCGKCKKIHLKVQTLVQHEIIDVKSLGAQNDAKQTVITDNIPCDIHKRKAYCMYCQTCDTLVCPDCISSFHKKHDLEPIDRICDEKMDKLKQINARICENLMLCKSEGKELYITEAKCNSKHAKVIKEIDKKEKEIKDAISKYAQKLRENFEMEEERTKMVILQKRMQIEEEEHILKDKQDKLQAAIESNHGGTILTTASKLGEHLPELTFKQSPVEIVTFFPGEVTLKSTVDLFGTLQHVEIPKEELNTDFEVLNSYTTDLTFVARMMLLDDKTAWISNSNRKVLRQVLMDENIQSIQEIPISVYDMALTHSNNILLSTFNSSDVKLSTNSGDIEPFLSVLPLNPLGIHVTKDNDIILGVKENGDNFKLRNKSCRKIIIFGMDGKQKQSYEYDKYKKRLFTIPYRITTNVNNDILVIDRISKLNGRVIVLGKEGDVKWIYQGHPQINTGDKQFNPSDTVTTSLGHVIMADWNTDALHVLSGEGDLLTYKVMSDQGIKGPVQSLDIDIRGQLWIGCTAQKGKKNAKIHTIKIYS